MSLHFQCPSCKKDLIYEGGDSLFQVCRHCTGKIIVPSQVVHQQEDQQAISNRITREEHQLNPKLAHIKNELKVGNKINAIKIFKETYGTDLSTAKEAVEAMQFGGDLPAVSSPSKPAKSMAAKGSAIAKSQSVPETAIGKAFWVLVRIVFFAAIAYWFFN